MRYKTIIRHRHHHRGDCRLFCRSIANSRAAALSQEFKDYWYSGEAELTRYELEQARYGEIHRGDAVLIFVTEDFRTDKQVKV